MERQPICCNHECETEPPMKRWLAPGWVRLRAGKRPNWDPDDTYAGPWRCYDARKGHGKRTGNCGAVARYAFRNERTDQIGACEDCAPYVGVFAPSAPAESPGARFWKFVDATAREVETWPAWKRGPGLATPTFAPPPKEECGGCAKVARHPGEGYECAFHPNTAEPQPAAAPSEKSQGACARCGYSNMGCVCDDEPQPAAAPSEKSQGACARCGYSNMGCVCDDEPQPAAAPAPVSSEQAYDCVIALASGSERAFDPLPMIHRFIREREVREAELEAALKTARAERDTGSGLILQLDDRLRTVRAELAAERSKSAAPAPGGTNRERACKALMLCPFVHGTQDCRHNATCDRLTALLDDVAREAEARGR